MKQFTFILITTFTVVFFLQTISANDDIYSIKINQAAVKLPNLLVYLYVLKSDNSSVKLKGNETFKAYLGDKALPIKEILPPEKFNEGIAYIFLIDISKSIKNKEFKALKDNINKWIDKLKERDKVAFVTFGKEAKILKSFTENKDELRKVLSEIQQTDNQTRLYGALKYAIQWSQSISDENIPSKRAIVIFSDGINDFEGGETKEEVIRALSVNPVPIYALGYASPPLNKQNDEGLKTLAEFSSISGGQYVRVKDETFSNFFDEIYKRIYDVNTLIIDCSQCPADGKTYRLQIGLNTNQKVYTDSIDIRILAFQKSNQTKSKIRYFFENLPYWVYILIATTLLLSIIFTFVLIKRNRKKAEERRRAIEAARQAELAESEKLKRQRDLDKQTLKVIDVSDSNKGIQIRLDKVGIYERDIKYQVNISNNLILGRGDADVIISGDEEISRQHCQIIYEKGDIYLIDLNSTNGTYLNGVRIQEPQKLKSGDIITLGRTELIITFINE